MSAKLDNFQDLGIELVSYACLFLKPSAGPYRFGDNDEYWEQISRSLHNHYKQVS